MDGSPTAGGEPRGLGPYAPLLAILKLNDATDLEFVTVKDIEKSLPEEATLQHKVNCLRLLKQAKEHPQRAASIYSTDTSPSILASASIDSSSADAKSLAGVLRLQPPDGKPWQGTSDTRPATAFLHRVAESARLAALNEMDTWRYLTTVCMQQSQARELDTYLLSNSTPDLTLLDRLRLAEEWFNNRWSITNNVDKIYSQLRRIHYNTFSNVEKLHDTIVNLQQHARYLQHEIPLTALRRAFLDGLPIWLSQPLLQVHPQSTTPLHVLVEWCTSYEESQGPKRPNPTQAQGQVTPVPCRLYQQGRCTYGALCKFAHLTSSTASNTTTTTSTSTPAPDICRKFRAGSCIYGDKCKYSHQTSPVTPSTTSSATTAATSHSTSATTSMAQLDLQRSPHCLVMVPTSDETPTSPHVALIDTGSCDSMISLDLVEDLRLPIKYLDVPYTAYIMNGDSIMYHATVTLTWRFHDGPDKDFSSTFLVSPRLPQPFAFVLGSDLQRSEGFFFNPTTNEMVFTPVRPQEDHIHLPPTSNDDPDKNIASDATRHYEANSTIIVMQTPHFIITAEPDQLDASKKIFTVDIKPDAMPPKKPRPARLQQRHHLNQQQKEDPTLYNETQEKLQGLIERGCLKPVLDDDQQNDDYYYLTTTYYGVRGSKRARPVFPFGSLNRATKEMLKECPTRQESLYSILDSTRGFDLLQLLDVSDAFFRIQTGVNLRELLTVFIDGRRYSFCNMPYGPNISPFILLACMSHVCTTTKCPYSIKYYMDDIATNHPQPQQLQELFAAYDFPTTLVDVATVDTAPFLGLETADYGRLLQYSEKGWRNFTSFQMPAHPSLRQSLMLLGRIMSIPEVLPFFFLPIRNLLQSLIAKYYRQVLCWDAPLPDELSCMLREFHDLYKDTNLPQLQRYIDPSESLHIYTDAGAYCGCYRFFQNGNEVLRGQYSFSATECALHINYKEFLMVLQALQRLVLLETRTGYQFQSLNVYVDSKTVLAILKHGRIKAGPMQVYIEKKFRLLQELLGERLYDINFSYVETSNNLADIGTRNDLHRRLVHLRDYSKEPFAEEVCHPLQAAVIPAQQVPTGKRKRQIAPTDADPVIKKQCIRPANRVLVTRDILLAECREKQELLDKKILTLDTLGYARLSGTQRLYIPQPIQQDLLRSYHEYYAHPGKKTLYDLVSRHWWFPRLSKVCSKYQCIACTLCKSYHHKKPLGRLPQPQGPLSYLAIDFTGPYADTELPYAVTISDMYTRLFRVFPTAHPTTESVCKALDEWKVCYGQYPELLMHDNDKAFSQHFAQWCLERSIKEARTAVYSPESNSAAERPHRTFHDGLRACLYLSEEKDWVRHADAVVHRMNIMKNAATGKSPYEMLLNTIPRCPFYTQLNCTGQSRPCSSDDTLFPVGTVVARRVEQPSKLQPRYEGCYEVLAEVRPGTFQIRKLGSTSPPIEVKQDRLKAYPISPVIQHF